MVTPGGDVPAELSKLQHAYELLGELSRDDLVTIYVARDRSAGREVAIKVLRAADAHGRETLAHYASDARLLTALDHPNIVTVHSVKWLTEDVVAVVTERVRGPSLRQVLDVAGTLPVARATEVLRGLGRALAWAHSSQIMHRDLRPEHVIFEDRTGRVVLSDFGLARRVETAATASEPTSDPYRAPELADGRYPDRRSDVYSLGIVGWELLTGRRPWPDDMEPIAPGQRAPQPPPLAEVRPGLPPALVAAIEDAVQLDRDRRITDVVTFMERLTKVAPPPRAVEEDEEEESVSVAPAEWVALPMPRMPRPTRPAAAERDVAPDVRGDGSPAAEPPVAAAELTAAGAATAAAGDAGVLNGTPPSTEAASASGPPAEGLRATRSRADRPIGDTPIADRPIADRPIADSPVADSPIAAGPVADRPVADRPVADEPIAGRATADHPIVDQPETEGGFADGLHADHQVVGQGAAETPGAEPPVAERPFVAERVVESPVAAPRSLDSRLRSDDVAPRVEAIDRDLTTPARTARPAAGAKADGTPRRHAEPPASGTVDVDAEPEKDLGAEREEDRGVEPDTARSQPRVEPVIRAGDGKPAAARGQSVEPVDRPSIGAAPPTTPPAPPRVAPSEKKRSKKGGGSGLAAGAAAATAATASGDLVRPDTPAVTIPPRSDSVRSDARPSRAPLADAPPAWAEARETVLDDAARVEPRTPRRPAEGPIVERWSAPLSDVELPPPEPVPFADTRAERISGPVSGPVRGRARPLERFEPGIGMRGGLAASRPAPPSQDHGRDSSGTLAPAPLQPVWDTPAEFPLPVMPDPRPMPADIGGGATAAPGRRWTPRGIGIAAVVVLALLGAITLLRMERAPDTTAELMRPETPAGYGGDIAIDSPSVASPRDTSVLGPTSARPGGNASRAPGSSTARPGTGASPSVTAPRPAPATAQPRPPAARAATPTNRTRSGSTAAARTGPTTASRAPASAAPAPRSNEPAARTPAAPAPAAVAERPSGACGSPALADQRACLSAHIERNDAALNATYEDVIVAMRQRASSAQGDPDPPEVQRLRAAQRSWLVRRDAECRRRGRGREGPLWATPRAQCLGEFSAERSRELSTLLYRLRRN